MPNPPESFDYNHKRTEKPSSTTRFTIAALLVSSFSTMLPGTLTSLLLIDLATAFNVPLGIMSQLVSTHSSVTMIAAVCMGGLSVRFRHKSLLLLGLVFFSVSALGCSVASDYLTLMVLYSISGLGMAMVNPMINTIVGEQYSLEKRSSIVGWLLAAMSFSAMVNAPVISAIADYGGWRVAFLGYVLVVPLVALVLVFKAVPSRTESVRQNIPLIAGFQQVLSHRSAFASLVAIMCSSVTWQAEFFSTSFVRDRFLIPQSWAALLISGTTICFTCGSLLSGRLVNRFGRKGLTSVTVGVMGMMIIGHFNIPNFWISEALLFLACFVSGIRYAASNSLALEQLPLFRGTMMSLNSVVIFLGYTISTAIGGAVLLLYGWELLGFVLGAFGLIAALIFKFCVSDTVAQVIAKS